MLCTAAVRLGTGEGYRYAARFPTRPNNRYCTIRLPWALFRPEAEGQPPLDAAAVGHISLRYALRSAPQAPGVNGLPQQQQQPPEQQQPQPGLQLPPRQPPQLFVPQGAVLPANADPALRARQLQQQRQRTAEAEQRFSRFALEVDWIKALPSGVEPEFVLVSCAGAANRTGIDASDLARVVSAKRRGEDSLRASGLGYTIIRPGPLVVSGQSCGLAAATATVASAKPGSFCGGSRAA